MSTYEPLAGENIVETAQRIVEMADELSESVTASFNDIQLTANPGDSADTIVEFYHAESNRRHEEWLNSPEAKEAERQAQQKQANHDALLKGALEFAPEHMTLRDEDAWKKAVEVNQDPYGKGVIEYAERWARLMEGRMSNGSTLEESAEEASHIANNEDITNFMYGAAVSVLAQCWIHGDQLRRWHNLSTQLGNEGELANESGGVLNPALLNVQLGNDE